MKKEQKIRNVLVMTLAITMIILIFTSNLGSAQMLGSLFGRAMQRARASDFPEPETPPPWIEQLVDSDGDGIPDQEWIDCDGDGNWDWVTVDSNGDGDFTVNNDNRWIDGDDDGVFDGCRLDTNGDGLIDTLLFDVNQDGKADHKRVDTDGDGVVEELYFDYNKDGFYDMKVSAGPDGELGTEDDIFEEDYDPPGVGEAEDIGGPTPP